MAENKPKGITSDMYLEFLKFGLEKGFKGVTEKELLELAKKLGYFTAAEIQGVNRFWHPEDTTIDPEVIEKIDSIERLVFESFILYADKKRTLTYDSYFKLLEHEELVLARESAQSAKQFSTWAIIIAFVSLVVSSISPFASAYQVGKPITLTDTQYQGIVNTESVDSIAKRMDALNGKLDTLIKATEAGKLKPAKQN